MKNLKLCLALLSFFICNSYLAQSGYSRKEGELEWYTDIMKAHEASQASKKPLFALFTGSDWCFWCKKLQANVISKPEFVQWAKKNVVLLELDFPKTTPQSQEQMQQNASLQQTFGVQGYPTVWLFFLSRDVKGTGYNIESLGSLFYPQGAEPGKEEMKFIKDANTLLEKKNIKK